MASVTIRRHCVTVNKDTGLSPLQQALLDALQKVRIVSAPTGAGKSYAFQYAMANGDARILFIIPTRRLAQNLAVGLIENLIQANNWPQHLAEAKVAIWSSDAANELRGQGIQNISAHRLRQISSLEEISPQGEIIFAIPETVSYLLLQRRLDPGLSAKGILDLLTMFDHVVFDEFHTIIERGFGLAAVCAKLATSLNLRAKISFLSATPLNILPVLEKLGVPTEQCISLNERLVEQGRPLHGDVRLTFITTDTMLELINQHKNLIIEEVKAKRQVVIIYDKLGDLKRQLPQLAVLLKSLAIESKQVLVINSIDDSLDKSFVATGFACGRKQNPVDFAVLIATSSVEVGITFRNAQLLLMEPGFEPLNFLQRYGRVARGDYNGQVFVRCQSMSDKSWQCRLNKWLQQYDGKQQSIEDLTSELSADLCGKFQAGTSNEFLYFGSLSIRAAYTAGLYWNALLRHKSNTSSIKNHLIEHQPTTAKCIYKWLKQVRSLQEHPRMGNAIREWCDRFEQQAYILRDIGQTIGIIDEIGHRNVPIEFIKRETDIFTRYSSTLESNGKETISINGVLEDFLLDEEEKRKQYAKKNIIAYFPHTRLTEPLPPQNIVEEWCRKFRENGSWAWDMYFDAMQAAENLVRNTGLIVTDDELLLAAGSGVF
jgi:CRISPR-associated endonuclease/helicase Cas3